MSLTKRKSRWIKTAAIALGAAAVIFSCVSLAGYAVFTIADEPSFTYTHTYTVEQVNYTAYFDCYVISNGYEGTHPGIAVGWHNQAQATKYDTPNHLDVPTTITNSGSTYNVVAVAKGGFRYCDFSSVSLPNAMEEIREEGFAYCQNLKDIALPHGITEIAPSTFLDCRNLETVSFRDANGNTTTTNEKIKSIGDHAFMSCIKLKGFNCPDSVLSIGDSAFQGCKRITTFFLPGTEFTTPQTVPTDQRVSLGSYAFADCSVLSMVHFDVNLQTVGTGVFSKCDPQKLLLNYTGDAAAFENLSGVNSRWRHRYAASDQSEQFLFQGGKGKPDYDRNYNYPGLYFTIDSDIRELYLDQSTLKATAPSQAKLFRNNIVGVDSNTAPDDYKDGNDTVYKYATITSFTPPSSSDFGDVPVNERYYNEGVLKIPSEVKAKDNKTYPVRVIDTDVFSGLADLTSVAFPEYLVQIRQHAFLGSANIATLDFSACNDLLEVGTEAFHWEKPAKPDETEGTVNTALTSLILPDCLKYIGCGAFANFTKVASFHMSTSAVWVGERAFQGLGKSIDGLGTVDMVLPNTLRDGPVNSPNNGFKAYRYTTADWDETIQRAAFIDAKCLKTVTMEPITQAIGNAIANNYGTPQVQPKDAASVQKPYRNGIQARAFEGCSSLLRFEANDLFYYLGENCFKYCPRLKEIYLPTLCSRKYNSNYPWGPNGQNANSENSVFGNEACPECVIYVDTPEGNAPKENKASNVNDHKWNMNKGNYANDLSAATYCLVPTYYGVTKADVKYYDISSNEATKPVIDDTDFSTNVVAFIEKENKRTITRAYCTEDIDTIDMSTWANCDQIKAIGDCAFARMSIDGVTMYRPGKSLIILPEGLESIGDRAFFRSNPPNSDGVAKITYREDDDGANNPETIAEATYFCVLPPSVTKVGQLAFRNNRFQKVQLNANLASIDIGAFLCNKTGRGSISVIDGLSGTAADKFTVINNGLYYKGTPKTLLYQSPAVPEVHEDPNDEESALVRPLSIDGGTIAVGSYACAASDCTSVALPSSLTTIYGAAFTHCDNLKEIDFGESSNLKYIGAKPFNESEAWSSSACTDITKMSELPNSPDIKWNDRGDAFSQNANLTTVNFTKLTKIVKIGRSAFYNSPLLTKMVGDQKYVYYKWSGSALTNFSGNDPISSNVLDLSPCTNLRSIGCLAFGNLGDKKQQKYVHLPNNYDGSDETTALYLSSREPESDRDSGTTAGQSSSFGGNEKTYYLVGEKSATANVTDSENNASRYPSGTFNGSNNKTYYHAESESDFCTKGTAATNYWYELQTGNQGEKRFVLLEGNENAKKFFDYPGHDSL